jgi:hypothetical protein
MFGPQRERPCPMCMSLLSAWDSEVPDIQQRVALAVVARSAGAFSISDIRRRHRTASQPVELHTAAQGIIVNTMPSPGLNWIVDPDKIVQAGRRGSRWLEFVRRTLGAGRSFELGDKEPWHPRSLSE